MSRDVNHHRQALLRRMVGVDTPRLWCPPITHYTPDGDIDVARMTAHWQTMVAHVGGFLVPGSTGDGWEMTAEEIGQALTIATDLATQLDTRLLIGVLRTDVESMLDVIQATVAGLKQRASTDDALVALQQHHVSGFTICPPKGAQLCQAEIKAGLATVLALGLPTAVYQLPQVTGNEISPKVFAALAARYPNFLLFKDTSGQDRVPLADRGASGIFLVRGAEGNYAQWLKEAGGCYDGLLLSTANCFAATLGEVISLLEAKETESAQVLSGRLTTAVDAVFDIVAHLPDGNAFANANKAMDHVMAYGARADTVAPPTLHAGSQLPKSVIERTHEILLRTGLAPSRGYLAKQPE